MANVVLGCGPKNAKIMVVGESPGSDEDIQLKPFVGKSGKLLDEQLKKLGIKRSQLYVTNLVKERPPNNRKPTPEEIAYWAPYLIKEIEEIKPELIVTLGATSTQFMLGTDETITELAGKLYAIQVEEGNLTIYILPGWHPNYVNRNKNLQETWLEQLSLMKDFI